MGWKAVKDHYGIEYTVHMDGGDMHVGAGYLPRIITVTPAGEVTVSRGMRRDEIDRIAGEMEADTARLLELMAATDTFERSIPVYTWSGADILERHCETPEWPNVTHDGEIMYENRYSQDRAEVVEWARESAESRIEGYGRMVEEARADLTRREADLAKAKDDARRIAEEHPISGA